MKTNSRATNLRWLQDSLAALSFAASDARLKAARNLAHTPLGATPPPLPRNDRAVLHAARRAAQVGATTREIAAAALLPLDWAKFAAQYDGGLSSRQSKDAQ